jgi:molybdate transport system ATP-binding protein
VSGGDALAVRVRVELDRFALDVDFTTTHRVTGVFGVSGAGKTTLLETVMGLRRRAAGTVRLGETVWLDTAGRVRVPPERRGVGYVPQDSLLFPHLSVLGNLRAGRGRALRGDGGFHETLETVVRVLELAPLLQRDPATLSGGERQRVALGRALAARPDVLCLDEPLSALDEETHGELINLLRRVHRQTGVTVLHITHNRREALALAQDLIELRDGRCYNGRHPDPRGEKEDLQCHHPGP